MNRRLDFTDLGPEAFPLTIRAFRDEAQVWTTTLRKPGSLDVPALGPVWMRFEYADGDVVEIGKSRISRALSKVALKLSRRASA